MKNIIIKKKKKIYYLFKYFYHRIFTPFYKIGWRVAFSQGVEIDNSEYIQLGSKVYIGKNSIVQVDSYHLKYGHHKPKLIIRDNVTIGSCSEVTAANNIEIEDDVIIAPHCYIADNSHCFEKVDVSIRYQGLDKVKPIKIKKGAWLGWGVVVLPGVMIGQNSVIGANSVVTKDVPDYSVAVGAPAMVIKQYDFNSGEWVKFG